MGNLFGLSFDKQLIKYTTMKHLLILLPMFFVTCLTMAQDRPLIEVEGMSEIRLMPDEALIHLTLTEKAMKVSEATQALNKKTKSIEDALKKSGVKSYEMYVDNYFVNVNRIYTRGSSKDSGYVASQQVRVMVKDVGQDLVKVSETLHNTANMDFNVQFQVSKELRKSSEKELLQLALEDAKTKATVIADAMNLGQIIVFRVNYSKDSPNYFPVMRESKMMMSANVEDFQEPVFRPEEQVLNDKVAVQYSFVTDNQQYRKPSQKQGL